MKKLTLIVLLGLAVAAVASMESSIIWTSKTLDLGEVPQGVSQSLTFQFVNKSEEPARILSAKGSCGCTQISYPEDAVQPGESATIAADFSSSNLGVFQKSIRVQFEGQEELTYLYFKGEVVK